jgi:uncharacterized membrane protein
VTIGTAINSHGHVTGYWGGAFCATRPFIWKPETGFVLLTLPPWLTEGYAWGINDNGWICGTGQGTTAGQRGWVRTRAGQWIELLPLNPPTGWSGAHAINNHNVVCGYRSIGSPNDPVNPHQAFMWSQASGFTDLGVMIGPYSSALDIDDAGRVVGWTGPGGGILDRGFLWKGGETTILPPVTPGGSSIADAIDGQWIVGYGTLDDFLTKRAFIFDLETVRMTTTPAFAPCTSSECEDVAPNGLVIGSFGCDWYRQPFVWQNGMLVVLEERVELPAGAFPFHPYAINDKGAIVLGVDGPTTRAMLLVEKPHSIGDVNNSCRVDVQDLLFVVSEWGKTESDADLNHDHVVNIVDLLVVIEDWTLG